MIGHGDRTPSRRLSFVVGAFAVLSLLLTALGPGTAARAQGGEVRIGYQKFSNTLLVLKAQQDLEKRLGDLGYTVSWVEFAAGLPLLEALNAGSIDFGSTGSAPPVFAQAAGTDLIYALASKPSPKTLAILVPKDSPITSVADLKGKRVAVQKGSNSHLMLVQALQTAGLQWSDIEPAYLAPADAKAAFEGGGVDAWSIWDPYLAAEEDATGARVIADGEYSGTVNRTFYLVSRGFATDHADALKALEEEVASAETWSAANKAEVAKLASAETGIAEPTLLKVEQRLGFGLDPVDATIVEEQQQIADLFYGLGLIPTQIDVAKAVLPSQEVATS